MRGQRETRKTLNKKEMRSWDKEVKKSKRRYRSSKEIKDHLHFAFLSAFSVIIPLWSQTAAPTQNDTNRNERSWQIGLLEEEAALLAEERAADSGESMVGQGYDCNWLLLSPSPNLQPQKVVARVKWDSKREQTAAIAIYSATTHLSTGCNVTCMR